MRQRPLGYFFAGLSAFMASILIITAKWTLTAIDPLSLSALVFPIGAVVMGFAMLPGRRWARIKLLTGRDWFWVLAFNVLAFAAIWTHFTAIAMLDPTLASFISRFETLVTVGLGMWLLAERFTKGEGFGGLLIIAGIIIMKATLRGEYDVGFWMMIFSAVLFGSAEFAAKIAVRTVDPLTISFIRNVNNSIMFWIAVLIFGGSFEGVGEIWPGILIIAFAGPILTRPIYLYALKYIEVSKVALINQVQPVFVAIMALILLNQIPALREVTGGVVIIIGCLLVIVYRPPAKPLTKLPGLPATGHTAKNPHPKTK